MSPARCAAYAAPSTPEVSEPLAALPTPAGVRNSFAKQSGSEGSRASPSVWELAGEHFNHVARALGTAQPGWVCSALPPAPRAGGEQSHQCLFHRGLVPPAGPAWGWGAGTAGCAPHNSWLCSPQQLAVLPTSSLTPQRGPLNRHFHTPAKGEVTARRLLAVPWSCRGAKLQRGEGGRPQILPRVTPAGLAGPRGASG